MEISPSLLALVLLALSGGAYLLAKRRALAVGSSRGGSHRLHSRPAYHGALAALWCGLPAMLLLALGVAVEEGLVLHLVAAELTRAVGELPPGRLGLVLNEVKNLATGGMVVGEITPALQAAAARYRDLVTTFNAALAVTCLGLAIGAAAMVYRRIAPGLRARSQVERILEYLLLGCSAVAILTTIGIVLSLLFEAIRFFKLVPLPEFLFGLKWSPQIAIRSDQVGSSGAFGAIPVFAGTIVISVIALMVAVPTGLFSAIYLAEYADRKFRQVLKPILEILAGIPTVVYGFFAALTVGPLVRRLGTAIGLEVASESALAAGLVMGIMIIPFVSSLSDDVINAVPQSLRDGAYALGATKAETVRRVVLPAALPGLVGSVLLAASRAIGETMIVVMAAGLSANLTANPLQAVTTVTVQIVTLLVGDQEFDSPKTLAAFALALTLFVATLILNLVALQVVRRYREQYE